MNFFEVKIGKRTRRGSLEVYNSFVIKTELSQNDAYYKMLNKYSGFDIELNQIQEIKDDVVEQKQEVKQEAKQEVKIETSKKSKLEMETRISHLGNKELLELREDYLKKFYESRKAEELLVNTITSHLEEKFSNVCKEIRNLESSYDKYLDLKYTLILEGDLIETLEKQISK
jgi:predicted secreted protein